MTKALVPSFEVTRQDVAASSSASVRASYSSGQSTDSTITAVVLVATLLGIFLVLGLTFYALHRGACSPYRQDKDEELAVQHNPYKPNKQLILHDHHDPTLKTAMTRDRWSGRNLPHETIRKVVEEYHRERLINTSNRCSDLMLQNNRVTDIPAEYDCPFNSPVQRKQEKDSSYSSPFSDDYRNEFVKRYASGISSPKKLRQRRCVSNMPPTSIRSRYKCDIVADYLNGSKWPLRKNDRPLPDTGDSMEHTHQSQDISPFRSRRVSPSMCVARSHKHSTTAEMTRTSEPAKFSFLGTVPGIVSDEARSEKSPVNSQRRSHMRRLQFTRPSIRTQSEPVAISRLRLSSDSCHLTGLRSMLLEYQQTQAQQSEGDETAIDDASDLITSSEEASSISIAAPCYTEAITGRIPVQSLLVQSISPFASQCLETDDSH